MIVSHTNLTNGMDSRYRTTMIIAVCGRSQNSMEDCAARAWGNSDHSSRKSVARGPWPSMKVKSTLSALARLCILTSLVDVESSFNRACSYLD